MKRIILTSVFLFSLVAGAFSDGFFSHRFFEIKVDTGLSVSNNIVRLTDLFQENPVIDFSKIVDDLNGGDFNLATTVQPNVGLNLDIPNGLNFAINVGVDGKGSIGLSNSFFDFLGYGHDFTKEDEVNFSLPNTYADIFAVVQMSGGWNFRDWSFRVSPSIYSALVHANVDEARISAFNNNEAEFGYLMNGDVSLYTPIALDQLVTPNAKTLAFKEYFTQKSFFDSDIWKGAGFDIGVNADFRVLKRLTVGANIQIPIVPSRLNYCNELTLSTEYKTSLTQLMSSDDDSGDPSGGSSLGSNGLFNNTSGKPTFETELGDTKSVDYYINRPFRLGINFDFHPFGALLKNYGGVELAVAHPFAKNKEETFSYINYQLVSRFSLWDILSISIATERKDKVYSQKAQLGLNFRIAEVDVGVSSASSSFAKSFTVDGIGAYIAVCAGF